MQHHAVPAYVPFKRERHRKPSEDNHAQSHHEKFRAAVAFLHTLQESNHFMEFIEVFDTLVNLRVDSYVSIPYGWGFIRMRDN